MIAERKVRINQSLGSLLRENRFHHRHAGKLYALAAAAFLFAFSLFTPLLSHADEARYLYDDLGRLSQVIDGQGNIATYTYDAVGNLLSITRSGGGLTGPTVTAVSPNSASAGDTVALTLTGTGLAGATLRTDNAGISVSGVKTAAASFQATLTLSQVARTGLTNLIIQTAAGSATVTFTVNPMAPIITELSPGSGPPARLVRINGAGFGTGVGQVSVTFGGVAAQVINVRPNAIDTRVPAGLPPGNAFVVVTANGSPSQHAPSDLRSLFTVAGASGSAPVIASVAPLITSAEGKGTLRIVGSGFTAKTEVSAGHFHIEDLPFYSKNTIVYPPSDSPFGQFIQSGALPVSAGGGGGGGGAGQSQPMAATISTQAFYKYLGLPAISVTLIDSNTLDVVVPPQPVGLTHLLLSTENGDALFSNGITSVAGLQEELVGITPLPGLINIATNVPITARFTRPVNRSTVTAATFGLKATATNGVVSGAFSFSGGDTVVTFRPASLLAPSTQYKLTIGGIFSIEGLPLSGGFTGTFITGSGPDTASPTVTVNPPNGVAGVPFNTAITFTFSEAIDPFTLTGLQVVNQGEARSGTLFFSGQNSVATFIPASPFFPTTPVTVTLSGNVTDIAGNRVIGGSGPGSDLVSSFTSATVSDVVPPRVLKINPSGGATGISTNTAVSVTFTESLNPATVTTGTFLVSSGGVSLPGTVVLSNFNSVGTFLPSQPLPALSQINVSLTTGIKDVTGNTMVAPFSSAFTTQSAVDNFRPSVTGTNPYHLQTGVPLNAKIAVRFDERINPATINAGTFTVSGPAGAVAGVIAVAADQLSLTFTPSQPLLPNAAHSFTYSTGIKDIAGNLLFNPGTTTFTTGGVPSDGTGPAVVAISPAPGAQGVARNAPILIQFSEPLAAPSVTKQTVVLSVGGTPVEEDLSLEQNNTVIRVRSANLVPMLANTLYGIAVTFGVTDTAGNPVAAQYTSAFTTGPAVDTTAPTIVSRSPANNAINVARSAPITVTFNEPVDPITVNGNSFALTGGGVSGAVPGSYIFSSDRRTVTFTPAFPLFANQGYTLTTTVVTNTGAPIEDVAGNLLATSTISFTTALGSGTDLATTPAAASVVVNPNRLYADGQTTTTVVISNISRNGILLPNGTKVAVTADPAYQLTSAGGSLLGGIPSAADPRFKIFTTLGASVTLTYQSPNRSELPKGSSLSGYIQVAPVDAQGAPMQNIAIGTITLFRGNSITISPNPLNLLAASGSSSHVVMTVFDNFGNPVPAGMRVGVTADPVYQLTSLGGSIAGGALASDSRFKVFTTITGGIVEVDYIPPVLASNQTGLAYIQAVEVDDAGDPTSQLGSASINLSGSTGNRAPQPAVVAISPGNGQSGVGINAPVVVSFSQSLDPTTVTATTFSINSGGAIAGSRTLSSGTGGPNSVITFTPSAPLPANAAISVFVGTTIKSLSGSPLLASQSFIFSTGGASDAAAPSVIFISPPDGATGIGTNTAVIVQFSESMNAVSITPQSFTLSTGEIAVSGRLSVIGRVGDAAFPSLTAVFTPDQLLAPNVVYRVGLSGTITDTAGNPLAPFTAGFTTGSGIDNFQPSVIATAPSDGQAGVPQNARITLFFSERINPATVNLNTFLVGGPAGRVAGNIAFSADRLSATLTPSSPLLPNAQHTIGFSNDITDIAGNKLVNATVVNGITSSFRAFFTVSGPPDIGRPSVTEMNPASGAAAVPRNANILIRFSEPIAVSTVDNQSLTVSRGGIPLPGLITFEQNSTVVRWKAANLEILAANASYEVSVTTAVTDVAGNPLTAPFTGSFTTGALQDTVPPTVASVSPNNSASGIARSVTISVTFSEPIQSNSVTTATFTLTGGGISGAIPGGFSFSSDRKTVLFTPADPLIGNQVYSVNIGKIEDQAGNVFSGNLSAISSFTTGFAAGTNLNLLPDSATVVINPSRLYADGQTTTTVLLSNISRAGVLVPNGTKVAVTADPAYQLSSGGGTILGGATSAADPRFKVFTTLGGKITFTYRSPNRPDLAPGGSLSALIQVAQVDLADAPMRNIGNGTIALSRGKTATVNSNPVDLLAAAGSSSHVTITVFDQSGDPVPSGKKIGVTTDRVYSLTALGGTIVGGAPAADARFRIFTTITGGIAEVDYTPPLLAVIQSGSASIQVVEVDDAGNFTGQLGSGTINLSGATGNRAPQPVILAVSPEAGQSNVGVNAPVRIAFSQTLDPATVTATTFSINSGSAISGSRTLSSGVGGPNSVLTFTPDVPFGANRSINVFVGTGIKSLSGSPLLLAKSLTFSTGAGTDITTPTVTLVNPADQASGVGTNTTLILQFSESMSAPTLTPQSFRLSLGGVFLSGRVFVSSRVGDAATPSLIATFIPDQLLAPNTLYTISLSGAATDTAGNPLASFISSFTTGSGIDNFQPSVTATAPFDGQTGVLQNAKITLVFSERINPATVNETTFFVNGPAGKVAGPIDVSADQLSATLTPSSPLLPNVQHSISFSNQIADIAGNKLLNATIVNGINSSFRTFFTVAGPPDTIAPAVIAVSPPDGAVNLPLYPHLLIRFSEAIAPSTLNAQTITLSRSGQPVALELTLEQNGTVVRVKPADLVDLIPNSVYQLQVTSGVTDTAGNGVAVPVTSAFTTGAASDTARPTVISISPANGAQGVPLSASVSVTFSEPISSNSVTPNTFSITGGGISGAIPGSFTFSSDRKTVTFLPTYPLPGNQGFQVNGGKIEDYAGNLFSTFFPTSISSFSTGFAAGTDLLKLPNQATVAVNPSRLYADGQTTTTVTVSNINRSGVLVPNGTKVAVTADPAYRLDSAGGTILGGVASASDPRFKIFTTLNGGFTLTYRSSSHPELAPAQSLTAAIQVAQADVQEAPMQLIGTRDITLVRGHTFTVSPNPESLLAAAGSFSHITTTVFDSGGNPVPAGMRIGITADPVYVLTSLGGSISGGVLAPDPRFKIFTTITGGTIEFDYAPPILAATQSGLAYIQVVEVDDAGNLTGQLGSRVINLSGSTGNTAPQPAVLAIAPANGQTNVGLNAPITAAFSQPLDPASVTATTFSVNSGGIVPGSRTISAGVGGPNSVITFTPNAPWPPNASISLAVGSSIKSASGSPLLAARNIAFSTAVMSDTAAPSVVLINPAGGASGVGTNAFIMAQFSESINAAAVTPQSMTLSVGGTPVPGRVSVINKIGDSAIPSLIALFIPDQLLAPNATYTVGFTATITDTAGNPLTPLTSIFTTGTGIDNFQPSVVTLSPAAGSVDVPATFAVTATFSEPMNPATINDKTFIVSGPGGGVKGSYTFSNNNTVATLTPLQPLFAGGLYTVTLSTAVTDLAANPLPNTVTSTFTTALAPGTGTGNLPNSATVTVNPGTLFANGLISTTVIISNIKTNGTLVPNGTLIAVTAESAYSASAGGTISGSNGSASADPRFLLFPTLGASVTVTYTPADLTGKGSGNLGTASIQAASVDLDGRPVNLIGSGSVSLLGINSATLSANPATLQANGTATSTIALTVKDSNGNLVPDGTRLALTAAPIFSPTSAGGVIVNGAASPADGRVKIFTTAGGQVSATYQAPSAAGSGASVIQAMTVDAEGHPTGLFATTSITLNP